jgi:hypothetical protein
MSTLLERGMDMIARAAPKVAGGRIIYQRGDSRVWIDATWGRTEFQTDTADGVRIEHSDRDFIFASAALVLGGVLATPARGDRITLVFENQTDGDVFEVLAPSGAQPYRLCDPEGVMMRVYGKKIS